MPDGQNLLGSGAGSTGSDGKKSFFSKPENIVALIPPLLIGIAIFMFWGTVSGFVLHALQNAVDSMVALIELIVLAAVALGMLWMLFDGTFRNFIWYLYRSSIRGAMHLFVENVGGVSILKTYLEKMKTKRAEFQQGMNEISAQRVEVDRQIILDDKAYKVAVSNFQAAQKANDARQSQLQANQMNRLHDMLERECADRDGMNKIISKLSGFRDVCDDAIFDWTEEIKIQEREARRSTSLQKVMRSAKAILRGMPEDEEMVNMAVEDLKQKYAAKMGEVEQALQLTGDVVEMAKLRDSGAIERASKLLEAPPAGQVVQMKQLGGQGQGQGQGQGVPVPVPVPMPVPVPVVRPVEGQAPGQAPDEWWK